MDLSNYLQKKAKQIVKYIEKDAPRIVAKMARDHARQSFHDEGFTDDSFEKWQEVKRRGADKMKKGKKGQILKTQARDQRRKILTDSGDLKNSIQAEVLSSELVELGTDLSYAQAHNEGTDTAGRGNKTKIPKRQFIGKSKKLEKDMVNKFKADITNILDSD